MERIETDEQILDAIMNPEMPFEKIQSAVALEKEAKRNTADQEAAFDSEKLEKYKEENFNQLKFSICTCILPSKCAYFNEIKNPRKGNPEKCY